MDARNFTLPLWAIATGIYCWTKDGCLASSKARIGAVRVGGWTMQSEHNEPNLQIWRSRITQFLLGSLLGFLLILVPLSYFTYFTPEAVHLVHYIGSTVFVLLCGVLSTVFGDRFLKLLSALFESMPTS
jgi:hypothetical protein